MPDLTPERMILIFLIGVFFGIFEAASWDIDAYKLDPDHWHKLYVEQKK